VGLLESHSFVQGFSLNQKTLQPRLQKVDQAEKLYSTAIDKILAVENVLPFQYIFAELDINKS